MTNFLRVIALSILITSCGVYSRNLLPEKTPELLQQVSPDVVSDFIVQRLNENNRRTKIRKNSQQKKWYQSRTSSWSKTPELQVDDVLLTVTGESLLFASQQASLFPDYAGKDIDITLKGSFRKKKKPLTLSDFQYDYESPLIHQTFIGKSPQARILLNRSHLLKVTEVSETEIRAVLNTKAVPDFYLKGPHRLSLEFNRYYADVFVSVGEPAPPESLSPQIDASEVLSDENNQPILLLLKGSNFMLYPKFSYAMIDGEFVFGFQTEVFESGTSETTLHLKDPGSFDLNTTHTVTYATPFGTAFATFGGNN